MSRAGNHQSHDVDRHALRLVALWSAVSLLLVLLVVYLLWRVLVHPPMKVPLSMVPPAPRLQPYPLREREAAERASLQRLQSYGWVDRAQGIAHIPLQRAMQLVAASTSASVPPAPAPASTAATAAEAAAHRPDREGLR